VRSQLEFGRSQKTEKKAAAFQAIAGTQREESVHDSRAGGASRRVRPNLSEYVGETLGLAETLSRDSYEAAFHYA
jgi:hypothetical protein